MYDLAHVAGCKPYVLRDLAHAWLDLYCTGPAKASQNGRSGSRRSTVDRDLSDLSVRPVHDSYCFALP